MQCPAISAELTLLTLSNTVLYCDVLNHLTHKIVQACRQSLTLPYMKCFNLSSAGPFSDHMNESWNSSFKELSGSLRVGVSVPFLTFKTRNF